MARHDTHGFPGQARLGNRDTTGSGDDKLDSPRDQQQILQGSFRRAHAAVLTTCAVATSSEIDRQHGDLHSPGPSGRKSGHNLELSDTILETLTETRLAIAGEVLPIFITLDHECRQVSGAEEETARLALSYQAAKLLEDALARYTGEAQFVQTTVALLAATRLVSAESCITANIIDWAKVYAPTRADQDIIRAPVMGAHPNFWSFITKCILHGDFGAAAVLLEQTIDTWPSERDESAIQSLARILRTNPARPADPLPGTVMTDHLRHTTQMALRKHATDRRKWLALVHLTFEQYQGDHFAERAAAQKHEFAQKGAIAKNVAVSGERDDFDFFYAGKHVISQAPSEDEAEEDLRMATDESDEAANADSQNEEQPYKPPANIDTDIDVDFSFYHDGISVTPTKAHIQSETAKSSRRTKQLKSDTALKSRPTALEMVAGICKLLLGNVKHLVEVAETPMDAILGWLTLCEGETAVGQLGTASGLELIRDLIPPQQSALNAYLNLILREDSRASYALSRLDPILGAISSEFVYQTSSMNDLSLQAGLPRGCREHCLLEFLDRLHGTVNGDLLWQVLDAYWMIGAEGAARMSQILTEIPIFTGPEVLVDHLPQIKYCQGKLSYTGLQPAEKLSALEPTMITVQMIFAKMCATRGFLRSAIDAFGRSGERGIAGLTSLADGAILDLWIHGDANSSIQSEMDRLSRQREAGLAHHLDHPRLAFLHYLVTLRGLIKCKETSRAARLLCSLLKSRSAPRRYWLRMIHEFLPLLSEGTEMKHAEILDLLNHTEEALNFWDAQDHLLFLWQLIKTRDRNLNPTTKSKELVSVPDEGTIEREHVMTEIKVLVMRIRAELCRALQLGMRRGVSLQRA